MPAGRGGCAPRSKAQFVQALQALGYTVTSQGEIISTLLGVVQAQAEEIDSMKDRLLKLENRMPTQFIGG